MEIVKDASITTQHDGMVDEVFMTSYSPEEQEQNHINSVNAKLIESAPYVIFDLNLKRSTNLDFRDIVVYQYIKFFTFEGDKKMYMTNETLASVLNTSVSSLKRSLKKLKEKGLISSTSKILSNGKEIKTYRSIVYPKGQLEPTHEGQLEPQLSNMVNNVVYKYTSDKSQGDIPLLAEINNAVEDLTTSNPPSASDPLPSPKTFGNPDINLAKEWLTKKYPKPLREINNRVRLKNFIQALSPRKGKDEWMSEDWKENLITFMSVYLKEKAGWETENLFTLNQIIQAWRERGAPQSVSMANFVKTVNDLI